MTLRSLSLIAGLGALFTASSAYAADMPGSYPRPLPPSACSTYGERQADHVWEQGKVAYIVAESCDGESHSLSAWLAKNHIFPREPLRVYYNGGSMWKTDINTIDVPPQPQLH